MRAAAAVAACLPFGLLLSPASLAAAPYEKAVEIARDTVAHEWPFSVERGELSCFLFGSNRMVFFREPDTNDPEWFFKGIPYELPRSVIVSVNPLEIFASLEDADLFLPFDGDFAVLIRRLAPFAEMGQALCEALLAERDADDMAGDGAGEEASDRK